MADLESVSNAAPLPMPIALASLWPRTASLAPQAGGPDLTRYFVVCIGLLLGLLAIAWFFRRFVTRSVRRRAAKRSLHVLDVLPLGGRQKLVVVRCYDRSFLLGLGDKEVRSIAELDVEQEDALDEETVIEPVRAPLSGDTIESPEFKTALESALHAAPPGDAEKRESTPAVRRVEWSKSGILG